MKKLIKILNKIGIKFRKKSNVSKLNKVLIISNTALGDTILSTPVIKTLRKNYPSIYIELMVNKSVYALFNNYSYVNNVITYNKNFLGLINHILDFRKKKFDTVFLVHSNGPEDIFISLFSNFKTINKAINLGSDLQDCNVNYIHNIDSLILPILSNKIEFLKYQHIIEHRLDILNKYDIRKKDKKLELNIQNDSFFLKVEKKNKIVALQLGASYLYRMWPIENFADLINCISKQRKDITFVITGSPLEKELAIKLISLINDKTCIKNYCGETSVVELALLLKKCNLLITGDTGTLHLAIALRLKTLSLFSSSDSNLFGPYQDKKLHSLIQVDGKKFNTENIKNRSQNAMKLITPSMVLEKFNLIIEDE